MSRSEVSLLLPMTEDAADIMRAATKIADRAGQPYVGTVHITLAMIRQGRGSGYEVLRAHRKITSSFHVG